MSKVFIYKVKDDKGKVYSAVGEAEDAESLRRNLYDHGWYVTKIQPLKSRRTPLFFRKKIDLDNLIMFTHQLSSMLDVGIPMLNALDILWKQMDNAHFQIVISQLRNRLSQGASISEAFNDFPEVFPAIYRALLSVADIGANLVKILRKLLEYLNNQREFIAKLKRTTAYPLIVVGFAVVVVIVMLLWVIPAFKIVFVRIKLELPLFTRVILKISSTLRSLYFWIPALMVSAVSFLFYKRFSATALGRDKIDRLKLKIPVLGKIIYAAAVARFVRSLSLLVGGGLPIAKSIEVAKETAVNTKISQALEWTKKKIVEGASLGASLGESGAFPSFLVEMVSVGEVSGTLMEMLERVAVHFEEELDFRLNRFLTWLEPALIILVGGVVVFILLSIYLPIFKLWGGLVGLH